MTPTDLTDIDRDALRRSLETDCRHDPARRQQVNARLTSEDWTKVAKSCSYRCQITSLNLLPWESTILYADSADAHALARRLRAANLSRYEPDPIGALQRVEGKTAP